MMKHTNVKQIGCLICIAVLLVCTVGCGNQDRGLMGGGLFEVDNVLYFAQWDVRIDHRGQIVLSFITLHCHDYDNGITIPRRVVASRGTRIIGLLLPNGKEVIAKTETLYFIHDEERVSEKQYQELGIDACQLDATTQAVFDYLQPILENLIREHVRSPEPEMEEE